MLSCVTHICVQLPDLKFSPPRAWSELGVKKRGLSVDMTGVVPVGPELEDGLLRICFPLGIRAGTGLALVQQRY